MLFYAWNKNYQPNNDKTMFEMSHVDSVLLPETEDPFVIWLGAMGGDFNITIIASNAYKVIATLTATLTFALFSIML